MMISVQRKLVQGPTTQSKRLLQFFVIPVLLSQLTCSSGTSDLEITLAAKTFVLIDTSTKSCFNIITGETALDVAAVHFVLSGITFNWSKPNRPLTVHWVNFKLTGGALLNPFSATIGSDALLYSFFNEKMTSTMATPCTAGGPCYSAVTLPNSENFTTSQCPFKVGGIPIGNKVNDAYGSAAVTVYGTYQDDKGNTVPVTAKAFGEYFYKGTN